MTEIANNIYAECILPINTAAIRIIHLMPGEEGDDIQGCLRLLDLDHDVAPQYSTLSYVWGDPTIRKPAIINNQHVEVTKNLYDALRYVRSSTETVPIWADAICINQSDIDEKSRQVALMARVYRQCLKVHIWLGLPDLGSLTGNPFEFLEFFVQGKHYYEFPGFDGDKSTGRVTWKENEACNNILNDFLQVVKSPWWTRAWTVQECLLPNDTVLMFGTWTVTWSYILKARDMKSSHGNRQPSCCQEAIHAFNPRQLLMIEEWMWHPGWVERYRDAIHGNRSPGWFYQTLLAFTSRQCSDPRDKIYSLLSLSKHPIYQDFKPNYHEDVITVYIEIFTRMVRETNGNFICFMGGGFGSSMPGLPSWVRDFSQVRPAGVVSGEERRIWNVMLYQASLATPFPITWNEGRELHYRGTYADTVKVVGLRICTSNTDFSEVFCQWLNLCKEILGNCEATVLRNTFSGIICGDVCRVRGSNREFRRAIETDFPEKDVWDRLIKGDLQAMDYRTYGAGFNFAAWGRCLFTTYSGRMGLCHPNTLPGDEIWVMRGVQVPFVVRPLEHAGAGLVIKYSFMGDCFLRGIMDGELGGKEESMEQPIVMV